MARAVSGLAAAAVLALIATPVLGLVMALDPPPDVAARLAAAGMGRAGGLSDLPDIVAATLALAACVAAVSVVLGTALAWIEHRAAFPGAAALSVAALLPLAVPSYVVAGAAQRALDPTGWLGAALGLSRPFSGHLPAAIVLSVVCTPYVHLLVGAALARIPAAEEEAARSLGAGPWRRLRAVTLPRLRPTLSFALLLVLIYAIGDFGAVSVLDARVLTWRIYQAQAALDVERAVAMGFGVLALVAPLLLLARWVHGAAERDRGAARGGVANPRRAAPGRASPGAAAAAIALHLPVVGLGVVVPFVELASWVAAGDVSAGWASPVGDTALLATVGAAVTLGLALLTAGVAARGRAAAAAALDHGVFLLAALPGVLVAFGLGLAALWGPPRLGLPPLRDALRAAGVLVLLGYATRYLAEGHGGLKAALLRLDPRPEECARSLGAGPARRLLRVTLPALLPALVAAFLLLFLALVKELPVTLMVAPLGARTLAYRVWERYTEGFLADAGAAGLLLLGLAVTAQLATLRWRRHA